MGFWKDVDLTMQYGISKEEAINICAAQRYGTNQEKEQANKKEDILITLNNIKHLDYENLQD